MRLPPELDFLRAGALPQRPCLERLDGATCVVTGATSGVGRAAALRLAAYGARIAFVARNAEKAAALLAELAASGGSGHAFALADLSDLDSVRGAARALLGLCPRIDALVNAAGVHYTRRVSASGGREMTFCVNHLAPFLLSRLLAQRLEESAPARVVDVNSEGHRFGGLDLSDLDWRRRRYGGYRAYGASKAAALMASRDLARELSGSGVTVNAMHPGAVRSAIGMNNGPLYRFYAEHLLRPFLADAELAGEAIHYLVASPELAGVSGRFYNLTNEETPAPYAVDEAVAARLVSESRRLCGLPPASGESSGRGGARDKETHHG